MAEIDINKEIQAKGLDFTLGLDTQTIWASGAQVFVNPDFTLIVFRDQTVAQNEATGEASFLAKNVARIVVPTPVIREINTILTNMLSQQPAAKSDV